MDTITWSNFWNEILMAEGYILIHGSSQNNLGRNYSSYITIHGPSHIEFQQISSHHASDPYISIDLSGYINFNDMSNWQGLTFGNEEVTELLLTLGAFTYTLKFEPKSHEDLIAVPWVRVNRSLEVSYTQKATTGGVIGDPIVVPVHGNVYSLPCDNCVYRYLGDDTGQVIINVRHELSDSLTIQEINSYCASVPQARQYAEILKSKDNVSPYAFPRYVYIAVDGNTITFDLKNLIPIRPLTKGTMIHRAVETNKYTKEMAINPAFNLKHIQNSKRGLDCNKLELYNNEVGHQIKVSVDTSTYGTLSVTMFRFKNEQLRSGVSIKTERGVTEENSTGAIVSPMIAKDCRLKKLHSHQMVINTHRKPKVTEMTFIKPNGHMIVMNV